MSRVDRVSKRRARASKAKVKARHLHRPSMNLEGVGFLSLRAAAHFLNQSEHALRGLHRRGEFPAYVYGTRLGRRVMFDKAGLTAYMKQGRQGALRKGA